MFRDLTYKTSFFFLFLIAFLNMNAQSEKVVQQSKPKQKEEIEIKLDSIRILRDSDAILESLKLCRETYSMLVATRKDSLKAFVAHEEGKLHIVLHDYVEAHKKFTEAKMLFQEYHDYKGLADVYTDFGRLCFLDGNFDEALDFFIRANMIFVEMNDDKNLASNQMELADMFFLKQDYTRALDFYLLAQTVWEQEKLPLRQADALLGMAKVFRQTGHTNEAQKHFQDAEHLYRKENALLPLARHQTAYAEMLFRVKKNTTEALERLKESEPILVEQQQINDLIENYRLQQAVYKQHEHYKEALLVSEKINLFQNDSWNQRKQQIFSELQTRFRTKELEEEIVLLRIRQQESEQKLRTTKIASIAMVVTLIVLLIYIVQRKKQTSKTNKQQE